MRDLTLEECEFISGGDIIVTGELPPPPPYYPPPPPPYNGYDPYYYYWYYNGGAGGTPPPPPPPPDNASVDVTVNISRPLTADEQQAVDDLKQSIAETTRVVNSIPDNAQVLVNGRIVTGADLKAAWANADFQINEVGTPYSNGTTNGEAAWNNGNPLISININTVNGYNDFAGGTNYLVLHELGHLVAASRADLAAAYADGSFTAAEHDAHERMANDIAMAAANSTEGVTMLSNPDHGYTSTTQSFQVPPPPPPPSGGGYGGYGGGGGWYYNGSQIP